LGLQPVSHDNNFVVTLTNLGIRLSNIQKVHLQIQIQSDITEEKQLLFPKTLGNYSIRTLIFR
ncbi:11640_t:CDS:1, partial [Entrophospora sp. SA101]